jgi:hypothetical protein
MAFFISDSREPFALLQWLRMCVDLLGVMKR